MLVNSMNTVKELLPVHFRYFLSVLYLTEGKKCLYVLNSGVHFIFCLVACPSQPR